MRAAGTPCTHVASDSGASAPHPDQRHAAGLRLRRRARAMAIYHLAVKSVSRSTGRSAVAAIAYRAAVCLENERDGLVPDYTRSGGVEAARQSAGSGKRGSVRVDLVGRGL